MLPVVEECVCVISRLGGDLVAVVFVFFTVQILWYSVEMCGRSYVVASSDNCVVLVNAL